MKTENKILRKSIVDNQFYSIDQLIRFSKNTFNEIRFDKNKNLKGRGAYCLADKTQIDVLFKKHLLNRAFKQNISKEIYDELQKEVELWLKK